MANTHVTIPSPPKYGPVKDWCAYSGMGPTTFYELVKAGKLRAIKLGGRTLVDFEHGLAWMASLPPVQPRKEAA